MRIIAIANRKGGAGKTTLASHLAVEIERAGDGPAYLMDVDQMQGLASWWDRRKAETPALVLPEPTFAEAVGRVKAQPGVLIIDTAPSITAPHTVAAIMAAHLVLIPVQPSPHDLAAVGRTVELAEDCACPLVFVLNRVNARARLTGEAAVALSQHGTVAPAQLANRSLYAGAAVVGQTAPEIEPHGPAAAELAALWAYLRPRVMGRERHGRKTAAA